MNIFSSCQKEVSIDGLDSAITGGTAVFSLVSSANSCSDALASGTFQAGTALDGNAKITVTVDVTKSGTWTFSTTKVNGFIFAGAGEFTATGKQVITLIAAGIPATAGSFPFNLNISGGSCLLNVVVTDKNSGGLTGDVYYKATIGGINYSQDVTEDNGYEAGSGMGGLDDVVFGGGINWSQYPLPAGKTEMGVDKGVMHNYIMSTEAQFNAFFDPGSYPYAPPSMNDGDGVAVSWTDPSGENWSTQYGTGDQTGSSFKIISREDANDALGRIYIKVKMQFNCNLYHETTGDKKVLTNGEMVAIFGKL